ncbi:putative phosphoenolpyruvate synthase regulatory protein [Nymphon striatum]|nr:putative phosphoenolpyruvate synthase regulatory protein [Nymphon striatum]
MAHSLLSQFPHLEFTYHQRSFVDSEEKARELVKEIYNVGENQGFKPLVFATMPETNINDILASANCHYYEIFERFLDKIGRDLHTEPTLANYPITEDDFENNELPKILLENREKIFATSIKAKRLKQIREKRIPNSEYASLKTCKDEIAKANKLYEKYGFEPMDVTKRSIEELAAQIIKQFKGNKEIKLHPSKDI